MPVANRDGCALDIVDGAVARERRGCLQRPDLRLKVQTPLDRLGSAVSAVPRS